MTTLYLTSSEPGVNYRNFAAKKATDLGVTGWCRNTDSGKVRIDTSPKRRAV